MMPLAWADAYLYSALLTHGSVIDLGSGLKILNYEVPVTDLHQIPVQAR
jgi:hypothetical protein